MLCPNCRSENLSDAKFCSECGAKLDRSCPSCGTANAPDAKFCRNCGARLVASAPESQSPALPASTPVAASGRVTSPAPARSAGASRERSGGDLQVAERVRVTAANDDTVPEGERKTVTALFADIKGSMELMEDLDPEEARAIVDPAIKLMIDAVHRYDGYVVQSTGDGIFALFGAPVAHEDHPQRALVCGTAPAGGAETLRYATA